MNQLRRFLASLGQPKTIWIIFSVGLFIRILFTLLLGERLLPLADQPVFLDMAENIANGKGIVISQELVGIPHKVTDSMRVVLETRPERVRDEKLQALWGVIKPDTPTAFFEPFYPIFLGGIRYLFGPTPGVHYGPHEVLHFGPKITIARLFQSVFDALVIPILFYLGVVFFTPATGGLAALIYCFYPYSLAFVTNLVTQNTYLFFQAVMVYFFAKTLTRQTWSNYILLGLSAGITLLTRISLITFIPFIIICLYLPLRKTLRWEKLAVCLLIMVLTIVPWVIRNKVVMGEALLLPTKGGRNLWEYNNQIFTPEKMDAPAVGVDLRYQQFAKKNYDKLKRKDLLPFPDFTNETEMERDRILNERVKGFILANPSVFVQLCGFRLYQLFRIIPRHLGGVMSTVASLLTWGWILPASMFGLLLSFKSDWQRRSVIYAIVLYTVGTHTLTASGIPHRVPTDPYFILLAAFCVNRIFHIEKIEADRAI
ncbi:MAG: glycosyltransferase family 39 protein [bacterium]|nr:glycosyltransferase family 39 protein [bacterium]